MANPQDIERSIEAARHELTVTIEALAERLDPQRLRERATTSVKERARAVIDNAFFTPIGSESLARDGKGQPFSPGKSMRRDRVGAAAGVVILYVALRARAWRRRKAAAR